MLSSGCAIRASGSRPGDRSTDHQPQLPQLGNLGGRENLDVPPQRLETGLDPFECFALRATRGGEDDQGRAIRQLVGNLLPSSLEGKEGRRNQRQVVKLRSLQRSRWGRGR